ncbi:Threonylcarbamoyl-AMP synthase [uncultured archaeon]|nr:Threonylcarbamoyl-AMP synthase [uncultured archaeon]
MLVEPTDFKTIVQHLDKGGLIAYPTDSSYALGCDSTKGKAVLKIYDLKQRQRHMPLLVLCSDVEMAKSWLDLNEHAKILSELMPAKLSIIVKNKRLASNLSPDGNVAYRVPTLAYTRQLIKKYGRPLVGTSANISGKKSLFDSKEVEKLFPQVMVIDFGKIKESKPSTIYDSYETKIVRQGDYDLEKELMKKEEKINSKKNSKKKK